MELLHTARATQLQARLRRGPVPPVEFRAALLEAPPEQRDGWVDACLGLDALPDDSAALPRGCVPYLPCPVEALLRLVDLAGVGPEDLFVDVGAGVGRAAAVVHLLTGAEALGVEVQPALTSAAAALTARLRLPGLRFVEADIACRSDLLMGGTVFFLYCPFSGARLEGLLDALEPLARARELRVGCLDLPLPERPWLTAAPPVGEALCVYRSTAHTQ